MNDEPPAKKHDQGMSIPVSFDRVFRNLHAWFQNFGRKLPWRETCDPYAILVSEFMLQQTRVETVKEYFPRWMQKFPTLQALAASSEDQILEIWQGLGYYTRAKNLQRTARSLLPLSTFPTTPEELSNLPGIGEYTAHAIAAFAFDRRVPVVDANIARVLARFFDYSQPVDTASGRQFLRGMATALLPPEGGRLHNSALMELGALICKPRQPLCGECPLQPECRTRDPKTQPVKRARTTIQSVVTQRAFLFDGRFVSLSRSRGKWWKGLWTLPELGVPPPRPCDHSVRFSVTHHRVVMQIWKIPLLDISVLQQFELKDLRSIPMPSPHRRGLAAMLALFDTLSI